MRRALPTGGCALLLVLAFGHANARAGEKDYGIRDAGSKLGGDAAKAAQDAMMEQWAKLAQPGAHHERFKRLVGTWKTRTQYWDGMSSEPVVSYGSASFRLILGGRYVEETFRGEHMGKPFEGCGITGYDNFKQEHVMVWMDNMGTGIMNMKGDYDAATKTLTSVGEMDTPMGKMKMRGVSRELSNDEINFQMYMPGPDGKEFKHMEITYTRA